VKAHEHAQRVSAAVCPWAKSAPMRLCNDAAEDWSITKLWFVFARAHARVRRFDDGHGRCVVCGAALDFDAWLDEQDARDAAGRVAPVLDQ
jgi:hypothetical protein